MFVGELWSVEYGFMCCATLARGMTRSCRAYGISKSDVISLDGICDLQSPMGDIHCFGTDGEKALKEAL